MLRIPPKKRPGPLLTFEYHDPYGNTIQATKRLTPLQTLYAGRILEAPRRSVKMYEFVTK